MAKRGGIRLYGVNDMEVEASLPEKKANMLSPDFTDYRHFMTEKEGGEDYKAMAWGEKN